jgi:DNA-binding CsgD family transcriptional regulator
MGKDSLQPAVRLRQIAEDVRILPSFDPARTSDMGAELLAEALDLGAFSSSQYARFRLFFRDVRRRRPNHIGNMFAFGAAVELFAPSLWKELGPVAAIHPACGPIAEAIEREANRLDAMNTAGSTPPAGGKRKKKRRSLYGQRLTMKQREVLDTVAECHGNKSEAARRLHLNPSTVRQQFDAGIEKLGRVAIKPKAPKVQRLPSDRRERDDD